MAGRLGPRLGRARRALPAWPWPRGPRGQPGRGGARGLRGRRGGEAGGALGPPSWGEAAGSGAGGERRGAASAGDVAAARGAAGGVLGPVSGGFGGESHLLVMVHGLFGRPRDWRHVVAELQRSGVMGVGGGVRLLVSSSNRRTGTFDGVDRCGERLAREVSDAVAAHPELQSVSFVGHSLGGLIARYAAGILIEEGEASAGGATTVAKLRPELFCTIVTPHLGCDPSAPRGGARVKGPSPGTAAAASAAAEARVPFLEWVGKARVLGPPLQSLASVAAAPASSLFLGRTGSQLFLRDRGWKEHGRPLLVEMARGPSTSEEGSDFWRALGAFRSRVAYSNVRGDHMVGWPNASIRRCSELPLEARAAGAPPAIAMDSFLEAAPAGGGAGAEGAPDASAEVRFREEMLRGLQGLQWRRVDVSLDAQLARLPPVVPHNHIQARPPTEAGLLAPRHLAEVLRAALLAPTDAPAPPPPRAGRPAPPGT